MQSVLECIFLRPGDARSATIKVKPTTIIMMLKRHLLLQARRMPLEERLERALNGIKDSHLRCKDAPTQIEINDSIILDPPQFVGARGSAHLQVIDFSSLHRQ